jgi:hypothetical protein
VAGHDTGLRRGMRSLALPFTGGDSRIGYGFCSAQAADGSEAVFRRGEACLAPTEPSDVRERVESGMSALPDSHALQRRSIRLPGFDYTSPGAYFITVCTAQRQLLFGNVVNAAVQLNRDGDLVQACWDVLPHHFPNVATDAFVVMPNHIHGIIVLTAATLPLTVGAQHAAPLRHSPTCGLAQ